MIITVGMIIVATHTVTITMNLFAFLPRSFSLTWLMIILSSGRTTPEALSFNVRMVARLAAPLAFFYLGWISENGIR